MSFTCPVCWRTSYSAEDEQWGYCGNCHDFTGASANGIQRYSSSGNSAGSEGEMRMQPDNEEPEAQPEVSQVQGEGNSGSLRGLPWERMERNDEADMLAMQRTRVSRASGDPIAMPPTPEYPSKFRFYSGALGLGAGMGITWTVFLTGPLVQRHIITRDHALMIVYALAVAFMGVQAEMLYRWNKQLKKYRAEMAKFLEEINFDPQNPLKGKSR